MIARLVTTLRGEGRGQRYSPGLLTPARALPIIAAVLVLVGGLATPGFFDVANVNAILRNASITGTVAVFATFLALSGNFVSLSTQQSTVLATVIFILAINYGLGWFPAVLLTLAILIATGVLQGIVVAFGLNPIITTLAAGGIIYGVFNSVTGFTFISLDTNKLPSFLGSGQFGGIPSTVLTFLVVTVVASIIVHRTTLGRRIILCGANRAAAELSGISTGRVTIWAFVFMAMGTAIGGIITAGLLGQVTPDAQGSLTIDVVAATLVGGTSLQGGQGSPIRTAAGAVIMSVLVNLMILHGFPTGVQQTVEGALVVAIVVSLRLLQMRGA